jgi:fatty-acyl-CoA synthase
MAMVQIPPRPWPTGTPEKPEPLVTRVLAPNPSPYTFTGTQTYLVGEGADRAVIDPGDMGYMAEGYLFIVGRAKDMIIINGKNHWPQDIEWAVEQLPGFNHGDIAAFSVEREDGEEAPAVLVHCRVSDPEERRVLRERIREKVQSVTGMQCLVELVPPRTLPRTSSGKLSRAKAKRLYLSGEIQPYSLAA